MKAVINKGWVLFVGSGIDCAEFAVKNPTSRIVNLESIWRFIYAYAEKEDDDIGQVDGFMSIRNGYRQFHYVEEPWMHFFCDEETFNTIEKELNEMNYADEQMNYLKSGHGESF